MLEIWALSLSGSISPQAAEEKLKTVSTFTRPLHLATHHR